MADSSARARAEAAAPGIALTITHFVGQVLADTPTDVLQALKALRHEHVERARAMMDTVVALHR
ncbi:hypothetical protein [Streptomyces sp. NPDC054865]